MEHALWLREDTRGRDKWHLSQTTYATPDWVDVSYCGRVYVNVGPDTVTAERPSGELPPNDGHGVCTHCLRAFGIYPINPEN